MVSAQSAQYLIGSWSEYGFGDPKSGHGLQSLGRWTDLVLDVSVQSGLWILGRFRTLAEVEQNLDKHRTKVGQSLDLGVQSLDGLGVQPTIVDKHW